MLEQNKNLNKNTNINTNVNANTNGNKLTNLNEELMIRPVSLSKNPY